MHNSTALAFDFGTKQIGVAFGQRIANIASPIGIIPAKDGIPDWTVIKQLIDDWKPEILLIGLPLNMDDTESDFCLRTRKFAKRLHGRFGLHVAMIDERLTTYEAKQLKKTHRKRKTLVDAEAAALLINSWLDSPELTYQP